MQLVTTYCVDKKVDGDYFCYFFKFFFEDGMKLKIQSKIQPPLKKLNRYKKYSKFNKKKLETQKPNRRKICPMFNQIDPAQHKHCVHKHQ